MTDEQAYKIAEDYCYKVTNVGPESEAIEILLKKAKGWDSIHYNPCPWFEKEVKALEDALNFKLFTWQITYIFAGEFRQYGETTAEIIRGLLTPGCYLIEKRSHRRPYETWLVREKYRIYNLLKPTGLIKANVRVMAGPKFVETYDPKK